MTNTSLFSSNSVIVSSDNSYGIFSNLSNNDIISGNSITASGSGSYAVYLVSGTGNIISNNNASSNGNGIYLGEGANGNTISSNLANGNSQYGIDLVGVGSNFISNNTIINNTVNSNNIGIGLDRGFNNTIVGNTAAGNNHGIYITTTDSTGIIANNTITNNIYDGLVLGQSSNGTIYNNFFNNTVNTYIYGGSINSWNTALDCTGPHNSIGGHCIGGNFWAQPDDNGWSQNATNCNANSNGICTSLYVIDGSNIDELPLTKLTAPTVTPHPISAGGCSPVWQCGNWSECGFLGSQSRTCNDMNYCGTPIGKPLESQICSTVTAGCEPNWQCTDYGECNSNGTQARACTDSSLCGNDTGKPDQIRECMYISAALLAGLGESDRKVVSDAQSILAEVDAAIDSGDYIVATLRLGDAISNAENLMTSETTAPAAQSILIGAANGANQLIAKGEPSKGADVLVKVSEAAGFLASRDTSAASHVMGTVLNGTNSLIDANQLYDAVKVLIIAKNSATSIAENSGEIIDELEAAGIDSGKALGLDLLGVITPDLGQIRDKDTQIYGMIIQSASLEDAERKQMLSQAGSMIKEMLDAAPEIKRSVTTTTITTNADIVRSMREQTDSKRADALLSKMESDLAAGGDVELEKSLSRFKVTNVEKSDLEIDRSLVMLKVNPLARMNNLTIVESIPKSVAESADVIIFPGAAPTVLERDPMLSWTFETVYIGARKQASYVLDGIIDSVDYPTVAAGEIVPFNPLFPELIIPEPQKLTQRELGERAIVTILVLLAIFVYMRQRGKGETPAAAKGETTPKAESGRNEKLEPFTGFENKRSKTS
jgi:parallel beta-helix repeat protein